MKGRATLLGTGTSHGVPMIGCACATCHSTDPRDRRLRPSIYIDVPDRVRILVDTATDLRQQMLTHEIARVDAVLFTHGHADHILGLDDIRRFNWIQGGPIACYAAADTWESVRRTFHYAFDGVKRMGRTGRTRAPASAACDAGCTKAGGRAGARGPVV